MEERYSVRLKLGNVRDVLQNSAALRAVVDPSFLSLIADVAVEALPEEGPMIAHNPNLETVRKLIDKINKTVDSEYFKGSLSRLVWPMVGDGRIDRRPFGHDLSRLSRYCGFAQFSIK